MMLAVQSPGQGAGRNPPLRRKRDMSLQKYSSAEVGLDHLYEISRIVTQASEWKPALNEIATLVRTIFIFDNIVVYLADPTRRELDVMYARAIGRGRSAEGDIAWGES